MEETLTPLWFWELAKEFQGVWAPVYSGFPDYANGRFVWPQWQKPISWLRIV